MISPAMRRLRIGTWTLDPSDGVLANAHASTRLEPKVLAVLVRLIECQGAVVTHEELLRDVWASTHVAPGALARTISLLRTALGDDAYSPRYIETVPKRGYRLIAAVDKIIEPPAAVATYRDRPRLRALGVALAATLFMLVATDRVRHTVPENPEWQFAHDTRVGNETAVEHYTRAIQHNPRSAEAHAGLATAYVFRANYMGERDRWTSAAFEAAKRAVELDAHSARAANAAAMAHLHVGRMREAEYQFRRSLELNPRQYGTPLNLAYVLMYRGEARDALAVMRPHIRRYPTATSYSYYAETLWDTGHLDEAVDAATAAEALEPFKREPQMLLIRHELVSGAHDAARDRLQRLLKAYPECASCIVQLGLIDQMAGRLDAAEAKYREARAMPTATLLATLRLAHVLTLTRRTGEAEALLRGVEPNLRQTVSTDGEMFFPRLNLATIASIRGHRNEAIHWLREAIRIGRRDHAWDAFDPLLENARPLPAESEFRIR